MTRVEKFLIGLWLVLFLGVAWLAADAVGTLLAAGRAYRVLQYGGE